MSTFFNFIAEIASNSCCCVF
ncbi:cyclic lactone autoinducer peptide [Priestia koreensis]|nr:cyclic lactone autoinducer peptide [Priestia koreensis]